jgi:hypothetical protein
VSTSEPSQQYGDAGYDGENGQHEQHDELHVSGLLLRC